jgi:hypothetical protein
MLLSKKGLAAEARRARETFPSKQFFKKGQNLVFFRNNGILEVKFPIDS